MKGLIFFILFLAAVAMLLRFLRKRELDAFMDADIGDFQTFKINQKKEEQVAVDPILARAEVYAALNPGSVVPKLVNADEADELGDLNPALAPDPTPYEGKPVPFDEVTRNMVRLLHQIVPKGVGILLRVPLAEFVKSNGDKAGDYKLTTHSVNYLLYDVKDVSLICGLQHQANQGQAGSDFVKGVFGGLGIPLLEFPVGNDISEFEIRDKLDPVLIGSEANSCPKCGESMSIRKATKGKNTGDIFWVCNKFPHCLGVARP